MNCCFFIFLIFLRKDFNLLIMELWDRNSDDKWVIFLVSVIIWDFNRWKRRFMVL